MGSLRGVPGRSLRGTPPNSLSSLLNQLGWVGGQPSSGVIYAWFAVRCLVPSLRVRRPAHIGNLGIAGEYRWGDCQVGSAQIQASLLEEAANFRLSTPSPPGSAV